MKLFGLWFVFFLLIVSLPAWSAPLDPDEINTARFDSTEADNSAALIKAQVLLDRNRYSPGVINGEYGDATKIALRAFQADNKLEPTGRLDDATFAKLSEAAGPPVLTRYRISDEDGRGPFVESIPDRIEDMARLERLDFTGPLELLAERFHMDEALLKRLNPDADFAKAGTEIVVAAVEVEKEGRAAAGGARAAKIVVSKGDNTLRVLGRDGNVVALYPATIGSAELPAPDGETRITRIARVPSWNYDPELELAGYDERPNEPMIVRAGPNNPVGTVWIALDRDRYGIHGTAEPAQVGQNNSSGCVRLTNWDVEELADLVRRGTPVIFQE